MTTTHVIHWIAIIFCHVKFLSHSVLNEKKKRNCLVAKQSQTNFVNTLVKQHIYKIKLTNLVLTYSQNIIETKICLLALSDLWDKESINVSSVSNIWSILKQFYMYHKPKLSFKKFNYSWECDNRHLLYNIYVILRMIMLCADLTMKIFP